MTSLLKHQAEPVAPWNIMPGWGVVADLTPPELIEMRRLRSLRKLIALALAIVIALCIIGYVFAMFRESSKQDALDATHDQGTRLTVQSGKYSSVVQLKNVTDGVQSQISTLMVNDVDVASLLASLRTSLPGTMSLTSANVSLTTGTGATGTSSGTTTGGTGSTDPEAGNVIGTVTLSGQSNKLVDIASYVTALQQLKGITNVLPANNSAADSGTASWSMTLSVTDKLLTHKYDATKSSSTGGN